MRSVYSKDAKCGLVRESYRGVSLLFIPAAVCAFFVVVSGEAQTWDMGARSTSPV